MTRSTRLRDAALDAAESGLYVLPCIPRGKTPALRHWEQVATRDPDQINQWWSQGPPWNIGAAIGRAGLVVIDLDHGRGEPAPEPFTGATGGRDVLAMLAERAGRPAQFDTWTVSTPSSGTHLYYRAPEAFVPANSAGVLGWKIDIRSRGGLVIAAGSVGDEGYYRRTNQLPAAELPDWLTTALTPPSLAAAPTDPLGLAGKRATAYVRAIVEGETHNVATAQTGTRHHTRLKAARTLGQLVGGDELDEHEAYAALREAARCHIGQDCTEREVENDIRDGLAYGRDRPRRIRNYCI